MKIYTVYTKGYLELVTDIIPLLCSYYYINDMILNEINERTDDFFLDSGAFSAHTKGVEINIDEYIKFIHKYKDKLTTYSVLDSIGNWKKTDENQRYMESNGLNPIPCYHYGEPIELLKKMVDKYKHIAIGGMAVNTGFKIDFLDDCFDIICNSDGTPKIKVHGFGMTIISLVKKYPWYSVDSTSSILSSAMGNIFNKEGRIIKLAQNTIITKENRQYIEENYKYTLEELRNSYKKRCGINIIFFQDLAKELTNNPPRFINQQLKLF